MYNKKAHSRVRLLIKKIHINYEIMGGTSDHESRI